MDRPFKLYLFDLDDTLVRTADLEEDREPEKILIPKPIETEFR